MCDPSNLQFSATVPVPVAELVKTHVHRHDTNNTFVDMVLSVTDQTMPHIPVNNPQQDLGCKEHPPPAHHLGLLDSLQDPESLVSKSLSPLATVWVPTINTQVRNLDVLYPPGKNSEGICFEISDEAWITLELGDTNLQEFDLPDEAPYDLEKSTRLVDNEVVLPNGSVFLDKILPASGSNPVEDSTFSADYFIDLHKQVRSTGTYNFAGTRVKLKHSKINVDRFRHYLVDYDDVVICQFLEYGFPIGLAEEIFLEPALKNHQSSYLYFSYIDKFVKKELSNYGIAGPLPAPPFNPTMLSPMMTSPKNPCSRRPVFDASWGDWSLNENTPVKSYMGGTYAFKFPSVLDFADMVVKQGKGCMMWKIDLSRWFLQLPVDPADYDKLGFMWRGNFFWFVSYVWGLRHAGYAGQRVASAILYILKKMGLNINNTEEYTATVYMDDFAGCEVTEERAIAAFDALKLLLIELGIQESEAKALKPSTKMRFLGIEFDSNLMCMQVDEGKRKEVTALVQMWAKKTVATKQEIQSILGKLMWVSRVVRYSRCFVGRIIAILKGLRSQKQKVTLSVEIKKDFLWWSVFLPVFNGIELLVPTTVFCSIIGDATLQGGGCWNERQKEYFSRMFPVHLQDHHIPIHLKEFFVAIVAAKLWGHLLEGKRVAFYCDNEAVVKTMIYQKPKDPELQKCLREMLFIVCKYRFQPVFLRVTTEDNDIADYISRIHEVKAIQIKFDTRGLPNMVPITVLDEMFDFVADW